LKLNIKSSDESRLSTQKIIREPSLRKPQKSDVIVQKVVKDYKSIKEIVEKNMIKAFTKTIFRKPKRDNIECEDLNLIYESFVISDIKYHLEYCRNKKYIINIDNKVVETTIFDKILEPTKTKIKSGNEKELIIEGKERLLHEKTKQVAFDRKGRIINHKNLPAAKTEPYPIKFLDSYHTNVRHIEVSMPQILKNSIEKIPVNNEEIIDEHIEIINQVLIYTPIFEARCINHKTHEIKIIQISAVTGKTFPL
jgi:hypothetical protein